MTNDEIKYAAKVVDFLMVLSRKFKDRWEKVQNESGWVYPFGDAAYGSALCHWHRRGCPSNSTFSYAKGEVQDPFFEEFRDEITKEFGLRILSPEEGEARAMLTNVFVKDVKDWLC